MSDIFGTTAPKFISSGTTVDLDHFVVTRDEPEYINLMRPSVLTHKINFEELGYYWHFEGTEYLSKYANPTTKYNEIMPYLYKKMQLYRFRDATPIEDVAGHPVEFILFEATPGYLEGIKRGFDILILKFQSIMPVDMAKFDSTKYILDEEGDQLEDESGNSIVGG